MRFRRIVCLLTLACLLATALPFSGALAESSYYITVDVTNQVVTVYDNGNLTESGIVRQMICSTGTNATPTPLGTYTLPSKYHSSERKEWYYFSNFNCYAKWATRVVGGILFHSVLFTANKVGPTRASVRALGSKASHGCIRLRIEDAKWIAENCPGGTTCRIFKGDHTDKDLRNRLLSRTFSRSEMSYDAFRGRAEGTAQATVGQAQIKLSRGKKGPLVVELQNRLRALGYLSTPADGKFGKSTKVAVNFFRAVCGLKQNGKVDNDLWNRLFAADAPVSTLATLTEGWQGPAVAVLQQALTDLKLFSGAVDGNYGPDTTYSVALYQQSFNYPMTGVADSALQVEAINRAQSVKAQFAGAPYQMLSSSSEALMALVNARSYTRLRNAPSKRGKKIARLYRNTQVKILSDDGVKWAQVQYMGNVGYVERKYLSFFIGNEVTVSYVPLDQPALAAPPMEDFAPPALYASAGPGQPDAPWQPDGDAALSEGLEIEYGTEPVAEPEPDLLAGENGLIFEEE